MARAEPELGSLGLWTKCVTCKHCWIVAYYPASATQVCKAAIANSQVCPKCGESKSKNLVVAKQAGGVLMEEEHA